MVRVTSRDLRRRPMAKASAPSSGQMTGSGMSKASVKPMPQPLDKLIGKFSEISVKKRTSKPMSGQKKKSVFTLSL